MTTLEKINSLTWGKLKEVLKELNSSSGDLRSYKVYTALLTQTGTSAPTAIVL